MAEPKVIRLQVRVPRILDDEVLDVIRVTGSGDRQYVSVWVPGDDGEGRVVERTSMMFAMEDVEPV